MKRLAILLFATLIFGGGQAFADSVKVCFHPEDNCLQKMENKIDQAKKSIFIQTGELNMPAIISSLAEAAKRKVKVKILLDKKEVFDDQKAIKSLQKKHLPLRVDTAKENMSGSYMIIDDKTLITGLTSLAHNKHVVTDVLFIEDSPLSIEKYGQFFSKRLQSSETIEQFCKHSVQCKFSQATEAAKKATVDAWEGTKSLIHKHIK